jgi:mRNA interferase RelE/StbE
MTRIRGLADDPRPPGEDRYRLRQGDYRVIYAIDDDRRIVEIVKIGHRREVYRD